MTKEKNGASIAKILDFIIEQWHSTKKEGKSNFYSLNTEKLDAMRMAL